MSSDTYLTATTRCAWRGPGSGVSFAYLHPELPFAADVATRGAGEWTWREDRLEAEITLPRQRPYVIGLRVVARDFEQPIDTAGEDAREQRLVDWCSRAARFAGRGDCPLAELSNRAVADLGSLALLDGSSEVWLAPAAGVPLYPALFGRDAFTIARLWPDGRTPECVGGYDRRERSAPGCYPHANTPQEWNQSALPILMQTLLGLQPLASLRLMAVDPVLPSWCPELEVEKLRIGDAEVHLRFWRENDGETRFETLVKEGSLRVIRQPPLESLTVGLWDRLGALAETLSPFRG